MSAAPDPTPDPAQAAIERVLAERARLLARPDDPPPAGDVLDLVVLGLGPERYGVDLHCVQEIQPLAGLTPVPGLPSFWAGLINLRGHLYPVLDLQAYWSLPPGGTAPAVRKVIIVAATGSASSPAMAVAVLADDVLGLRRLPLAALGPPLAGAALQHSVRGVTADLLTVLDLPALLADPALIVQETSV
jgi:purine-binding chemotaxis protein CheW